MKEAGSENLEKEFSQLISRLEKVKAPNDFAFKLKAKIAAEKQKRARRKVLLIRFSYALPVLIAVLSVAVFVYFLENRDKELASFREVSTTKDSPLLKGVDNSALRNVITSQGESEPMSGIQNQTKEESNKTALVTKLNKAEKDSSKSASRFRTGGRKEKTTQLSRTEALSVPETAKFSSGKSLEIPALEQGKTKISFSEILNQIGIEGSFEEQGGFRIKSLKPNSLAERSGFKPEDLIVAVDEKKLSEKEMYFERLEIRKFRIRRGIKELSINLKP